MLALRHGRTLLVVGWLLIAAIVFGSLTSKGADIRFLFSDKVRHLSSYLILMVYFSGLYPRERHPMLALAFFLLGAMLEVLQGTLTTTRHMDVLDLTANTLGIVLGFVFARLGLAQWPRLIDR
jgi:glycopeptide antibiotics resistance protein